MKDLIGGGMNGIRPSKDTFRLNWMTSTPPKSTMITIFRYKSHNTIQPKKEKESEKTVSLFEK